MTDYRIAASLLSANFACLGAETKAVLKAGADIIHFDVMDNHYVPNLTVGPIVCQSLRQEGIEAFIDVHLMVKPVDTMITAFAKAGANHITIHPEATEHLDRSLQLIKDSGCSAGLAFNPATPLTVVEHVIDKLDMILIMSVNPGFGGQAFIEHTLVKIQAARQLIDASGRKIHLEVDGGIKPDNVAKVAAAGADTFVAGSAIFGSEDYSATLAAFRKALV